MKYRLLLAVESSLIGATGGVEHVLCNMANEMNKRGYDVYIATMENKKGRPFFALNRNIHFYNLYESFAKQKNVIYKIISLYMKIKKRKYLKDIYLKSIIWQKYIKNIRADLVIVFSLQTLLTITYTKKIDKPVILTIHGNPINDYTDRFWRRPKYMNVLYRKAYQNANVIQVLLNSYKSFIPNEFCGEIVEIGNIAPFVSKQFNRSYELKNHKIISVGRLCYEKHQDLLIKAFAKISALFSDWTLDIYGGGACYREYNILIHELGMESKIRLKGTLETPKNVLEKSDLFVLTSRVEGFPLVLAEAMSLGLPCIGLAECDGTNEIIKHKQSGLLVSDSVDELAGAMSKLMKDEKLRQQYGMAGYKQMQNYTPEIIWNKWEELIKHTIKKK